MKHQGSSHCCCWFTLCLVATGIVLVSPDIHTTFADNYKQGKTKGTTATTGTAIAFKTLGAMGFIDANRYNANKRNNNNVSSYKSSMIASSNKNRNSVNSNTTSIRVPINEIWSQLEERQKHMVSTPQTMTIIVEKPTMVKHTTTTTKAITARKPTTTITKTSTTPSHSPIKKTPHDSGANINVSNIEKSTMIYKQQLQNQHEQHQHWQHRHQQQKQKQLAAHRPLAEIASSADGRKPQLHVANTLLDGRTSTSMNIGTFARAEAAEVAATSQTQIAISNNRNGNSNRDVDSITTAITTTTTTPLTTTQSQQFEPMRISYYMNVASQLELELDQATETDVKVAMARQGETAMEVEVGRQHQHKFSSSYLDEDDADADDNDDKHNYAPLKRLPTQRSRWARQAEEEEPVDKCQRFEKGDKEFYSPDYPNDYPKNINCTRVIEAPQGQIIRLDFRNSFHIEAKEECKFDFLEIRDGQYGFSNLLGKFCGTDFPPVITSKERYLWLHFHSDESIEYSGFTAVYEFIDRSREVPTTDLNCTFDKDGFEGFVNSSDVPPNLKAIANDNKIALDCMWRIQVQDNWKIQVKFLEFKLSKPNDCIANFLDIFPEQTTMPLRLKNFCGSAGEGITSESNVLHLRFFAEKAAINSSFAILYTAFRERGSGSCNDDEEYDCEDATCISKDLKCNGRDNCKFRWDEEDCKKESAEQSEHMIIIMVVFGLILGGMIITFLVNCIRKIMHDQKIIREHIRQSKESKLDELGRSSKARSRDNLSSTMPRPKHSQASLQILDDTSNRYYRELVPMTRSDSKPDLKEREHSILRHRNDMVVQTSFCGDDGDDNSSETTAEAQAAANACDMGCQTRESLFATPLMHQSSMGSLKDKASLHSRSRFSTFGYEASQPTPPPLPAGGRSQLTGLNIRDAQGYIEMRERHPAPKPSMPHMHRMNALPPTPPTPAMPPEICHHHHQHGHTHVHPQQQQQLQQQLRQQQQQQSMPQQEQRQQLSTQHSKESAAGGRSTATSTATPAQGKAKPKLSQSTAYIDIRNSAPDVIIMTSH
ncbi:uncharacterized protein LOC128858401 isoform X1 [Anastrepha ludens]|uniref:uncharacterized protein LOC128858401 isoform X1 n=1 Tax=Anastrepha ludens TaxID=28586 RepID=UPI0023AF29E8|nr:uncharacterized protein LOC128858401 isoform X1 [Anastrepha ludens]XP_053950628.1 uncharacterized protein LOC128858401 isoform X1 [Anastrepha ludens]XP_053950629.1 uncharacterized protein LOC128858401 isoform X1 [Anastrepha ludens]XP_053950630.1 uncharacterized protein LOC128858401 isoform X1 [Anastrepha ludens]